MRPVTFIQVTDTHLFGGTGQRLCDLDTTVSFKELIAGIKASRIKPDFFLVTGDLSQDGTPASYLKLRALMKPFSRPVYCLPGNHDHPRMKSVLAKGSVRCAKEILLKDWKLVLVDSSRPPHPGGWIRPFEMNRLKQALSDKSKRNLLISLHHNPIPVHSTWMDKMMVKNNKTFLELTRKNQRVKGVVFGHVHQEFSEKKYGKIFLGTPSACIQFVPRATVMRVDRRLPGFRWVKLYPDGRIESEVVRLKKISQKPDYRSKGY